MDTQGVGWSDLLSYGVEAADSAVLNRRQIDSWDAAVTWVINPGAVAW